MFETDTQRARAIASQLLTVHRDSGVFGIRQMPEDLAPPGAEPGSEEHVRFITLTVSIDYMRDANHLWDAARRTHLDPTTRYMFDPTQVANTGLLKLSRDMQRYKLAKKTNQDRSPGSVSRQRSLPTSTAKWPTSSLPLTTTHLGYWT